MDVIYGVILRGSDGGETWNNFNSEEDARIEANRLKSIAKENNVKGTEIYLSRLEYNKRENRLKDNRLVNEDSELIYKS